MPVFEASAPGRCGIVGNPSDIFGGVVVSCSLRQRARCRLTLGGDTELPQDPRLWSAATARFPLKGPVKVEWSTDIPRSSGLAGSTALLAATLACVLAAQGHAHLISDPPSFAELVRDIERNEAGVVCGYQDAYMAVFGGLQMMDFAGKHPAHEPGPPARLWAIESELPFLLVSTGVQRVSGEVHRPLARRWLEGEALVLDGIREIARYGRLGAEAILAGDWDSLASLMRSNHRTVASLGGSGEAIDVLVRLCESCGARAAKLAGAGHGGTVIALTDDPPALEASLREQGYTYFLRPAICPGLEWQQVG